MRYSLFTLLVLYSFFISCSGPSDGMLVRSMKEFDRAVDQAQPGDVILLAKGTWQDAELLFEGKGTEELPISLRAEKEGEVILSGLSNLRLAGEYLDVSGLF